MGSSNAKSAGPPKDGQRTLEKPDDGVKIVFLGQLGVGKTYMTYRLCDDRFGPDYSCCSTLGLVTHQ